MQIHHTKHHQAYVTNLNNALKGTEKSSLEDILKSISGYSEVVRNNAGGHYNHSLFWQVLTPNRNTQPSAYLSRAIKKTFGSLDSLKLVISQKGATQFGSGWAWLIVNENNQLQVCSTANQDNPLMDVSTVKGTPILGIDVWEHAYYLKYQNKRGDYLKEIWNVINWDEVSKRYEALVPKGKFDDWEAILDFHSVMSQTFHPSEKGNLEPIRMRSTEMLQKAQTLQTSAIPAEFDKPEIRKAIDKLVTGSMKLDKLVKSKSNDKIITKSLASLHDVFHETIGLCIGDHDHE